MSAALAFEQGGRDSRSVVWSGRRIVRDMSDPDLEPRKAQPPTFWTPPEAFLHDPPARRWSRPSLAGLGSSLAGPRILLLVPIAAAIIGVAFFFGPDLFSQELGIALICLGVGVTIIAAGVLSMRSSIDSARTSTRGAILFAGFFGPRAILRTATGVVITGFGALMLVVAFDLI
jgi:hypothetical protein